MSFIATRGRASIGAMTSTSWITWETAAELTGIRVPTIEHAVRVGRIRRRPKRGRTPTLDAESVHEWASWYRNLQEQKGVNPRRSRSTPTPLPPGEWLSTAEAAEVMSVTTATILRHADLGHLDVHRGDTRVWVSEKSVWELVAERDRWISWRIAADILGCPRDVIPRLIEQGHLEQRPVHRTRPSLSRASVEAYAPVYAEHLAEVQRRKAERREARASSSEGPPAGDVWLNVATTALVLDVSTSRVLQKVHAGQLPATQVGRRWWLRRRDVEQAVAVRAFRKRMDAS